MAKFPLKEAKVMALAQAMVSGLASHAFTARLGWIDPSTSLRTGVEKKKIKYLA